MNLAKKVRTSQSLVTRSSKNVVEHQQNETKSQKRVSQGSQRPPASQAFSKKTKSVTSEPFVNVLDTPINENQPQQNTFEFTDVGITISSAFDSGNLARCAQHEDDPMKFVMSPSGDGLPYTAKGHQWTWFYFSVKGIQSGQTLTFQMKHMAHQGKLHKAGLKPVFRTLPSNKKWRRCGGQVTWAYLSDGFSLSWTHYFPQIKDDQTVYFAWTYPWSYEESMKQNQKLMKKFKDHPSIYMHREVMYYSREHREMELITFSGRQGITEEREELIEGMFPEHSEEDEDKKRPFKFDKPVIFISARVHPGETPASFVLNGIWKILSNEQSEYGKVLREKYVWKIVPMLNPDGVYRGFFRLDTLGQNLNRFYTKPTSDKQPTIWAVKKAIEQLSLAKKLAIYVDLHAHASKRGCFMFGNSLQGEEQLQNLLLPKLISLNSLNFDFMECSFADKMMNCKDRKDGLSREGCGRVGIWNVTKLPNCYTLECNYASGKRVNHISAKLNSITGQQEPEIPVTDAKTKFYTENCFGCNSDGTMNNVKQSPAYTVEVFEDIGRAFCIGVLDFFECNPISRIPMSVYKNIQGVKNDILSHNPIFLPKKKEEELKKQVLSQNQQKSSAGPLRNNLNGSRQYAKSLQRNATQRQNLSGVSTQEISTHPSSNSAIASNFANKLTQKMGQINGNLNSTKAEAPKPIHSVRTSDVALKAPTSANHQPVLGQKNQSLQQNQQKIAHQQMLHNQFQRQMKQQAAPKNPNANHNAGGIGRSMKQTVGVNQNRNQLTQSQKNFIQMNKLAPLHLDQNMLPENTGQQNPKNNIQGQQQNKRASSGSSNGSSGGGIFEEEDQLDEILNKRNQYRQASVSSADLPSLENSSQNSATKLSQNSIDRDESKMGHKRRATGVVLRNDALSPSNQTQNYLTNGKPSTKNADLSKQQFKRSKAEKAGLKDDGFENNDVNGHKSSTRVNSKASGKRRKNYGSKRTKLKHEPDMNELKVLEQDQLKHLYTQNEADSKSESQVQSPFSHDACQNEKRQYNGLYNIVDEKTSNSFLPSTGKYYQDKLKLKQTPSSSLASASEYGKAIRGGKTLPKAISAYNKQNSSGSKVKDQQYSFDRGNSDLVKSIVNTQQNEMQQIENQILSQEGGLTKALNYRNSFVEQTIPSHQTMSVAGDTTILNNRGVRPKHHRGNSMIKNTDFEQPMIIDHDIVRHGHESKAEERNSLNEVVENQKRKGSSASQKHGQASTKAGSANSKYNKMIHKKRVIAAASDVHNHYPTNFEQFSNIEQNGGPLSSNGILNTELGSSIPSSLMVTQQKTANNQIKRGRGKGGKTMSYNNADSESRAHVPFNYFRMPTPPKPEISKQQPPALSKLVNPSTQVSDIETLVNSGSTPQSHHQKPTIKHMKQSSLEHQIHALQQQSMQYMGDGNTPNGETLLPLIPRQNQPLNNQIQHGKKRHHQNSVPPQQQINPNMMVPSSHSLFLSNSLAHLNAEKERTQNGGGQNFGNHKTSAGNSRAPVPRQPKSPRRQNMEAGTFDLTSESLNAQGPQQQMRFDPENSPFAINSRQLQPHNARSAKRKGNKLNPVQNEERLKVDRLQQAYTQNEQSLTKFQLAEMQYQQASMRAQAANAPLGGKVYHVNGNPYVQKLAEQARQKQGLPSKL